MTFALAIAWLHCYRGVHTMKKEPEIRRIVVASPGDVQAERDIVPVVVDEVNRWVASLLGVRFEVGRWETDAYPGLHLEGPQGLIDHVLQIENSDVLIGIFWQRFGTPTKDGTTGTEHEIRRAYNAWRQNGRPQVMLYFNQKQHNPRSKQEKNQWSQVLEFRRAFAAEGLWWPYKGKADFERLLRNHLCNFIRDNFMVGTVQTMSGDSSALQQLRLLPPAPGLFVGRDEGLLEIKERLRVDSGARSGYPTKGLAVVRGWPGVGKSSIAAALVYDAEVRRTFPDGILWISLGKKPSLISMCADWAQALGTHDLLKAPTLKEAVAQLTVLLSKKKMLLIVDDVWEVEHGVVFQQMRGSDCALLFTTRETSVAEAIAPTDTSIYNLPVLKEESALELLGLLAPSVITEHPKESRDLVRDLECLPLALQVAGRTLNSEAKLGWGVRDLLVELRSGATIINQKAPANRADLETQTIPTVAALFKQSTDRLDECTRECFARLGSFAPKPATFDLSALKAVWQTENPKPVVRQLVGRGLLEPMSGRFQMHALLVAHARALLTE